MKTRKTKVCKDNSYYGNYEEVKKSDFKKVSRKREISFASSAFVLHELLLLQRN